MCAKLLSLSRLTLFLGWRVLKVEEKEEKSVVERMEKMRVCEGERSEKGYFKLLTINKSKITRNKTRKSNS